MEQIPPQPTHPVVEHACEDDGDCHLIVNDPARAKLFMQRPNLDEAQMHDVTWIGSRFFTDTGGYYDSYRSSTPRDDWPYDSTRDAGLAQVASGGGYPSCRQWWADGGFDNTDGVSVLPFGKAPPDAIDALHRQLQVQPRWLLDQLELLDVADDYTVVLDTPAWPSPPARAALRCADVVVVTLEASARACADLRANDGRARAGPQDHRRRRERRPRP